MIAATLRARRLEGCAGRPRYMLARVSPETEPPVARLVRNIEGVILGKRAVVETVVAALLARGHVLVEDVPGGGQDGPRPFARPLPRRADEAHPVHARPPAQRRDRGLRLQ